MFSGIIRHLGSVQKLENGERLSLLSDLFSTASTRVIKIGDSIAVSGVCLTVCDLQAGTAVFDLASETCRKTTLANLRQGDSVNLEPSLCLGDPLDGHLVSGHVDAVGSVLEVFQEKNTTCLVIAYPDDLRAFIAQKGSIAVDGVSLTVGEVSDEAFRVYVIPQTVKLTTLAKLKPADKVNLEVDMFARYTERILGQASK